MLRCSGNRGGVNVSLLISSAMLDNLLIALAVRGASFSASVVVIQHRFQHNPWRRNMGL